MSTVFKDPQFHNRYDSNIFAQISADIDDALSKFSESDREEEWFKLDEYASVMSLRLLSGGKLLKTLEHDCAEAAKTMASFYCSKMVIEWAVAYIGNHPNHQFKYSTQVIEHTNIEKFDKREEKWFEIMAGADFIEIGIIIGRK